MVGWLFSGHGVEWCGHEFILFYIRACRYKPVHTFYIVFNSVHLECIYKHVSSTKVSIITTSFMTKLGMSMVNHHFDEIAQKDYAIHQKRETHRHHCG